MDELMINLFSLIAGEVRNKQELFDNEGSIMQTLLDSGYHIHEADAALMLMQTFVQGQSDQFLAPKATTPLIPLRMMNREERDRFTVDSFGFVVKLAHLGIISDDQREELLEKALTVYPDCIELEHIKSLVASVLFTHPLEHDQTTLASSRRIKRTAWN